MKTRRKSRRRKDKSLTDDEVPPDPPPEQPEQERPKARPRSAKNWARDTDNWYVRPASDPRMTYNYEQAIEACSAVRKTSTITVTNKSDSDSADDLASMSVVKRRRVVFNPTDKMRKSIEDKLVRYRENVFDPDFPASIPVCMEDFPASTVRASPPEVAPDSDNKYPTDTDSVSVLQKEIIRLDALNRALVKLSEVDEILVKTLLRKNKATESKSDKPSPEAYVIDAIRENCAKRESLIAESTAIVLAARRRDNFSRMKLTRSELHASVTRSVKDEIYTFMPSLEPVDSRKSVGSTAGTS